MSPEDWTQFGSAAGFLVVGGVAAWKATKAERQTRSTGNGFAAHVMDELLAIKSLAHSAHQESVGTNRRLDRIEGRLDRHLEHHLEVER